MTTTEVCFCKPGAHIDANPYSEASLWEMDGIKVCARGWNYDADTVWAINDCKNIVLAEAVADYYMLDAIKADMLVPRPFEKKAHHSFEVRLHHDTKWRECCDTTEDVKHKQWCKPGDRKPSTTEAATYEPPFDEKYVRTVMKAMQMFKDIPATMPVIRTRAFLRHARHTAIMAQVFRNYAHYAIAGELRHHAYDNSDIIRDTFGGASGVRAGWFKLVQHIGGAAAAKYAATMFMDGRWNGSYGGKPWRDIANALYEFESGHWDAWLFVDRMFSLQHNTGSALNKVNWKTGDHIYDANSLHSDDGPLDCHANSKFGRLGGFASEDVRKLATDYWVIANNDQIARGIEPTPMPEFTIVKEQPKSYTSNNSGCDCDLCQPQNYCNAPSCGKELNNKEINHSEYGGKCEKCAKTNNCTACGKAIVSSKIKCDTCKKGGGSKPKPDNSAEAWSEYYAKSDAAAEKKVTGYSLTPPAAPTKAPKFTPPPANGYKVTVVDDNDDDWEDDDTDGDVW